MAQSGHMATSYGDMSGGTRSAWGMRMSGNGQMNSGRMGNGRMASMPWGAIAAGFAAGLAVTWGRKLAVEAMSAMSGDWYDALRAEHQQTMKIFDRIEATRDNQTTQRMMLLTSLKHALAKHAYEEETVIYPALRLQAQKDHADHLDHDHGEIKTYLYELLNMPKDDPRWLERIRELRAVVEKHVHEEEDEIYPSFRQRMSPEENAKLTTLLHKEGLALA